MRILPNNNCQTKANQTNFQARTLKIGTNIMAGESLRNALHVVVQERINVKSFLRIIGGMQTKEGEVMANLLFASGERLARFADVLAPRWHEAKYTDGPMIDLTAEYNKLKGF